MRSFLARPRGAAWVAALTAVAVHAGALGNDFAFDDDVVVAGDAGIRSLGGLPARLAEPYWPTSYGEAVGSWRPLTTAAFALAWAAGPDPWVFHALDLLLHGAATFLVTLLVASLAGAAAAWIGGLVFAVHPVHVEAVANVVGLAEPLAAVFALAAALVWLRRPRLGAAGVAGVALLYALAVLAKEGAVVLPGLLVLLDLARRDVDAAGAGRYLRRRGAALAALAGMLAGVLWMRRAVLGAVAGPTHPPGAGVLEEIPRVWTLAGAWLHLPRLLVAPLDLSADYGPRVIPVRFGWDLPSVAGVAVVLLVLGVAWTLWRRGGDLDGDTGTPRVVALGVLWVGVALLPASNILFLAPMLMAERTLYLPSVGAALALGWLGAEAWRRRRAAAPLVAAVVLALAARSVARVPAWRDSATVMRVLLDEHPESGRAWWGLARRLQGEGRHRDANRAYGVALGLMNSEHQVALDAAANLMAGGRPDQARFFLERAWREQPQWYSAPGLLAALELNEGRWAEAERAARAAVALAPENGSMHHLLAQALAAQGRFADAARARRASIARGFGGRWRTWVLLAGELAASGDTVGAEAALDSALARTPPPEERRRMDAMRREWRGESPEGRGS